MVNAGRVAVIVKMRRKLFALAAQFLKLAASTHLPFKNLMESGVVYLKMTVLRFWNVPAQLRYRPQVNYLLSPENKKPAESSAGFLFLIITSARQISARPSNASDHQDHVNGHDHQQLLELHRLGVRRQLLQL
jgi:hypothetical protein